MSETRQDDPWAKVQRYCVQDRIGGRWPVMYVRPSGGWLHVSEVDAARAAEAAQRQQEIAAKDETIRQLEMEVGLWNQWGQRNPQTLQASKLEARLAAVEAERDRLKNQIIDLGARVAIAEEERTDAATLRAERDRLKAALSTAAFALDLAGFRRDRDAAYAALTPQGQSTDGETR